MEYNSRMQYVHSLWFAAVMYQEKITRCQLSVFVGRVVVDTLSSITGIILLFNAIKCTSENNYTRQIFIFFIKISDRGFFHFTNSLTNAQLSLSYWNQSTIAIKPT